MVDWFATGKYVANTHRQAELFGAVPTAEEAIARFAERRRYGVDSQRPRESGGS